MQIDTVVNQVLKQYDANKNGQIEENQGEYDRTQAGICNTPFTADTFLKGADTNHDHVVTRQELQAAVSKYDTNHNGQIDSASWFQRNVLSLFGVKFGPSEYTKFLGDYESETNSCD